MLSTGREGKKSVKKTSLWLSICNETLFSSWDVQKYMSPFFCSINAKKKSTNPRFKYRKIILSKLFIKEEIKFKISSKLNKNLSQAILTYVLYIVNFIIINYLKLDVSVVFLCCCECQCDYIEEVATTCDCAFSLWSQPKGLI